MRKLLTAALTVALTGSSALLAHAAEPDPSQRADGTRAPGYRATKVIAHRGASGYRPEHTMGAYELAIKQCADYIEPDLVSTKDGVLVDRHENDISGTTDVARHPEFADRKSTKVIDGSSITGWFTEDFTLAELKSLRAVERLPQLRPESAGYDGRWQVTTFEEDLQLASRSKACNGNRLGVVPEIKHSSYFAGLGLPMERKVVDLLDKYGYSRAKDHVVIQSFEVDNLKQLRTMTDVKLVQLIDCQGAPADQVQAGTGLTYEAMVTRQGLRDISDYADQVGLCKNVMIPRNPDGSLGRPTSVIRDAHANQLTVVGWTFRAENNFLPTNFRSGTDPAAHGDMVGEVRAFRRAGMDAFFTDQPDLGRKALAKS